jgi:hypothetical protein
MDTFLDVDMPNLLQENHTYLKLANILLDTLHCEVYGQAPAFQRRHGVYVSLFRGLLQAQTDLGWSQLFQGRLVQDWSRLQERFLETHNTELKLDRRYYTGAIWTRKVISLLWVAMRNQWDLRNADRHGRTKAANHAIRHTRLLQAITTMYANRPRTLAADRDVLTESPARKIGRHSMGLELWLKQTQQLVARSKADATAGIHRSHERLTNNSDTGNSRKHKVPRTNPSTHPQHNTHRQKSATPQCVVAKGAVCPTQQA